MANTVIYHYHSKQHDGGTSYHTRNVYFNWVHASGMWNKSSTVFKSVEVNGIHMDAAMFAAWLLIIGAG